MRALEARIPSLLGGLEEAATARAEAEGLAKKRKCAGFF